MGEDASGLGIRSEMTSLAEGKMDESVGSSIGRKAVVTLIGTDSSSQDSSSEPPWSLLSIPLPGLSDDSPSVVIRNDIDGLLFSMPPPSSGTEGKCLWAHTATSPSHSSWLPSAIHTSPSSQDHRLSLHSKAVVGTCSYTTVRNVVTYRRSKQF